MSRPDVQSVLLKLKASRFGRRNVKFLVTVIKKDRGRYESVESALHSLANGRACAIRGDHGVCTPRTSARKFDFATSDVEIHTTFIEHELHSIIFLGFVDQCDVQTCP